MPSDAKKKQMERKKEAAKARSSGKKPTNKPETNGIAEKEKSPSLANGNIANGGEKVEISAEGMFLTSKALFHVYYLKIL